MRQDIKDKILEVFYENPSKSFTVREMMKITKVPRATVHKYFLDLKRQNLIDKENKANNTLLFKTMKTNYFVEKIIYSGLVDELVEKLNPSCIILFGSVRKGDSVQESDVDLFVESSVKKEMLLDKYQKRLKHKIQLFIEQDINKIQPNLFNNIINGIKLYGSFKVK